MSNILSVLDDMDLPSIDSPMESLVRGDLINKWMVTALSEVYNVQLDPDYDYGASLRWAYEGGSGLWTFGSRRKFFFSHPLAGNLPMRSTLYAEGHVDVLWFKASDLVLELLSFDFIRFRVKYETKVEIHFYRATIDSKKLPDLKNAHKLFPCGMSYSIPIKLLKCWLQGKFQNPIDGLYLESSDTSKFTYECYMNGRHTTLKFPSALVRWIRKTGLELLNQLNEAGFLTEELLEILQETLKVHFRPSQPAIAVNSIVVAGALEVSDKDRGHLSKIAKFEGFLSISKWSKYLGLSKSGTDSLIKRFEVQGWISLNKGVNGTQIILTHKGKSVLIAVL